MAKLSNNHPLKNGSYMYTVTVLGSCTNGRGMLRKDTKYLLSEHQLKINNR